MVQGQLIFLKDDFFGADAGWNIFLTDMAKRFQTLYDFLIQLTSSRMAASGGIWMGNGTILGSLFLVICFGYRPFFAL